MKELAGFAFLAETAEPVLAYKTTREIRAGAVWEKQRDELIKAAGHSMFVRACIAHRAVALDEERACLPVRVQSEAVLFAQEVVEGEWMLWLIGRWVEDEVGD